MGGEVEGRDAVASGGEQRGAVGREQYIARAVHCAAQIGELTHGTVNSKPKHSQMSVRRGMGGRTLVGGGWRLWIHELRVGVVISCAQLLAARGHQSFVC